MKKANLSKLVEFVIAYCNIHGFIITPLKLQKILYYIQAWNIAKYDKDTLFDELPEAWVNGPVYRSVYDSYKTRFFKSTPLKITTVDELGELALEVHKQELNLDRDDVRFETLLSVLKFYSSKDEGKLVLMTHSDAPWNETREGLGEFDRCESPITVDSMYNFYNPKLNS